jgi:thiol-disulfide isomerase/thioredoxin
MANRQRAEARRKAQSKVARSGEDGSNPLTMWIALGVVLVLGIGIAIFATRGDDSAAGTDSGGSTVTTGGSSLPDSQPVTITGDPLVKFTATQGDPAIGVTAPLLTGLNFNGEAITIDPAANGPYMLVFLAHWCPHCNAEVPRLLDWKHSGAVPPELNVVGVATAVSPSSANYPPSSWFSNMGWEWPVMVDETKGDGAAGAAAEAYGASGWPYFVIVGADGKVKTRVSGEVQASELQTLVDDALAS